MKKNVTPNFNSSTSRRFDPVTILKPVKGLEVGLEANLESFFRLDYPVYELLFSIANVDDPARLLIETLMSKYPKIRCRLFIGESRIGLNPKVNNLVQSYSDAAYDWILISDSNICATKSYLKSMVEPFHDDVGVVTALVSGRAPQSVGAWLESVFLNTFYSRWMMLAAWFDSPIVIGKSMLFRKSDAQRFGGIRILSLYLAEDYMAGQAMQHLGRRIEVMHEVVEQPLGHYRLKDFWSRHLRWGRIRKSQAGPAFIFEPVLSLWASGCLGAWSLSHIVPFQFMTLLGCHLAFWFFCDMWMMSAMGGRLGFKTAIAWLVRECLHLPLWLHIAAGSTVDWRGTKLKLGRGGILKT